MYDDILYTLRITDKKLLNQVYAGHRPAHAWFLIIEPMQIISMYVLVCMCVYVSAPEAINN